MKKKKKVLLIVIVAIPIVVVLGYFLNAFFGNPISKSKAKKEVLSYYEEKYNKDFVVHSSKYNFLIPDYNITMGPSDNPKSVFETSRYELTMYDSYGAYLASEKLKAKLIQLVKSEFPNLSISVKAQEEHGIEVVGVEFDFFSTDPQTRLEKNYFLATIAWTDTGLNADESIKQMDGMARKLHDELKSIPKQLSLEVSIKDQDGKTDKIQRFYINGEAMKSK